MSLYNIKLIFTVTFTTCCPFTATGRGVGVTSQITARAMTHLGVVAEVVVASERRLI